MECEPEPLSEFVLDYKMQCDQIVNSTQTDMGKIWDIFSLSMDYAVEMKFNYRASANDVMVWGALFTRYMKSF